MIREAQGERGKAYNGSDSEKDVRRKREGGPQQGGEGHTKHSTSGDQKQHEQEDIKHCTLFALPFEGSETGNLVMTRQIGNTRRQALGREAHT